MRVLVIKVNSYRKSNPDFLHPVDWWRTVSPLEEIQKHTDWKVDYLTDWTFGLEGMDEVAKYIGRNYDLIVSSYNITNPEAYAWLKVIKNHYGVKHVLDIDDDLLNVDPENPTITTVWHNGNRVSEHFFIFDTIIRDATHMTVSTNTLEKLYSKLRKQGDITILPNRVDLSMYTPHKPRTDGKIVIGYFGGVSHHGDLHHTGFLDAVRTVLKRHKNVKFECVGMPVIDFKLPKGQYQFYEGPNTGGRAWGKFLSSFQWDICVAPLNDTIFNNGKSDIKWQESTAIGCPVVASFKRPYIKAIEHAKTGFLAKNKEDWIKYLEALIQNKQLRHTIANNALEVVKKDYALDNHWQQWKEYYEKIVKE